MAGTSFSRYSIPLGPLLFQPADVLPRKGQQGVLPLDPGGDLGRVPPGQLPRHQVGADDGGPPLHQPGVDDLIQGAVDKGRGHLRPQVVQDQQVAVQHPGHLAVRLLFPAELLLLELGEDVAGGVIDHGVPLLADLPGDGGGQVGLAQPRRAEEQEVRRALPELVGKIPADVIDRLHMLPDGDADSRVIPVRIPVCGEGVEALVAQVQHLGQLFLLFPLQ